MIRLGKVARAGYGKEFMFKLFHIACAALWVSVASALTTSDSVRINEINVAGPPTYNEQDGFIEFYNAGSTTAYLDGAMVLQGLDTFAQLAFKFPGEPGGQYIGLAPGSFLVLATDAYDHSVGSPGSPNLASADFETVIPDEPEPGDNVSVENLSQVLDVNFDWFFVRRWGQVLLTTGEFWTFRPCQPGEACGSLVCQVPLEMVVDGVEYLHHLSGDSLPRLNDAIDGGVILGIEPWTGQSAERINPGQDTDNSSSDFRVLLLPTPGFHSPLAAAERPAPVPLSPTLIRAWPNPFNPELTIRLNSESNEAGRLVAYNLLGREVAVLFEGRLSVGPNMFKWQANQSPSGSYWLTWHGSGQATSPVQVRLLK